MKKIMLSILSIFFCLGALVGGGLLLTGCDSPSSQTQPLEPGGGFDESQNENNAENDENLGDDNFAEATDVERTASVSFNANGGTGAPLKVSKTTDIYVMTTDGYWSIGLSIPIKQPTRSGYTFTSWNTSSNGSGYSYSPGGTIHVGGSRSQTSASDTLYAQWKYTPYTITFNSNGCPNGTMEPIKKAYNESVQLTPNAFWWGNDDYQFVAWATSPNSGTVAYENYGWYSDNRSITLYAIWDYKIRFDGNGATSGSMSTQTKRHGISLKLNTNNYKRTGCTFQGWALTSTGSVQYSDGGSYTRNDIATLYAVWERLSYNLTINFAYNYGTYNVSLRVSTNRGTLSSSSMSEGGSVTLTSDGTTSTHTVTIRETSPSPNYFYVGTSTTPTSLTSYSYSWTPTSNKSINIYTEQRYSITYNGNGNTGGSTSTTY